VISDSCRVCGLRFFEKVGFDKRREQVDVLANGQIDCPLSTVH
jgi:hypothetical protein